MIIMAVDNSLSMVLQLSESLQKAFPKATVASFTDPHKAVTYGYEQKVDAVFSYVAIWSYVKKKYKLNGTNFLRVNLLFSEPFFSNYINILPRTD